MIHLSSCSKYPSTFQLSTHSQNLTHTRATVRDLWYCTHHLSCRLVVVCSLQDEETAIASAQLRDHLQKVWKCPQCGETLVLTFAEQLVHQTQCNTSSSDGRCVMICGLHVRASSLSQLQPFVHSPNAHMHTFCLHNSCFHLALLHCSLNL